MSTAIVTRPAIHSSFGDDSPRARRSDPITSHESADTNDVSKSIGWVLGILREKGPLADFQIENFSKLRKLHFTGQRLRTARAALVRKGLVESTGIYRMTRNNRRAIVWQLSDQTESSTK